MQLNPKMKVLDQTLCAYVSIKDPSRKSLSNSVFMQKKQLSTFYGKMYYKANQQIKLEEKGTHVNNDNNKLLIKEQQRIREKIYSRTFHNKTQSTQCQTLSTKQNIKISQKPIITDNPFKSSKLSKGRSQSKFLLQANQQLLMTEYLQKSGLEGQSKMKRKFKSLSHSSVLKQNKSSENVALLRDGHKSPICHQEGELDEEIPHRRIQLIELYQKLYEQFTTQKLKTLQNKSRIQGKFSKNLLTLNSKAIKVRQTNIKTASLHLNKKTIVKL